MPGARFNNKPGSADELCNESQLELHLQRQLEEDVARIFDESIYSDLEVVCGKLKILTHSCILKARTHKFYHKLHTFLHVNIERNHFDEIYSFISDVYTECNIQQEEKEIITYLDSNLTTEEYIPIKQNNIKKDSEEPEVFLTPKCISPYKENGVPKVINSSPSSDLTKEYYALVPIDKHLLDKELTEQDALSSAFHSIIKAQSEDKSQAKVALRNKPTSLSLTSSHTPKIVKHSSSCDITVADQDFKTYQEFAINDNTNIKNTNKGDSCAETVYSPDSLITDEPSSSSDYLSAAYTCSPGISSSSCIAQVNVGNKIFKMENIYTLSDSGLDDAAMLGSVSSQKEVTLTNVSLSENTLHDLIADDASISAVSLPSSLAEKINLQKSKPSGATTEKDCNGQNSSGTEMSGKSVKEKKQRQNEEIVNLESSSLSSETGSWESVYPPKFVEKEICDYFLSTERQHCSRQDFTNKPSDSKLSSIPIPQSPVKSTSFFTDDSALVEEEVTVIENEQSDILMREKKCFYFEPYKIKKPLDNLAFASSTPNNSITLVKTFKQYKLEDNGLAEAEVSIKKERKGSRSPPIMSGGVSVEDHLPQVGSSHESSQLPKFKLENVPIVTGAYLPQPTGSTQSRHSTSSASAWVVDMSADLKTEDGIDDTCEIAAESINEKKNIFSMYIDLNEKTPLKDMPARLSSMTKKSVAHSENKPTTRNSRGTANITKRTFTIKDSCFEKYESLCNDPNISIFEIIAIPEKREVIPEVQETTVTEIVLAVKQDDTSASEDNTSSRKEVTVCEHNQEPANAVQKDLFVKLSDLDKPVQKSDILTNNTKEINVRMTRSIPDNNWREPAYSTNSRSIEVSFHSENALSLNRLFPHLKNEFSKSMPGSLSSSTRSPLRLVTSSTPGDADDQVSDMSEISSMQSSNCRSGFGNSTTDSQTSNLIESCTSRLGQDLLRMFLEEIAPDVIVEVSGKRFKAHKCILSSRCQYFASILSGGWVENLGNVIVLPPFSHNVVYVALCHIYSGLAVIPDSVSILELVTIADMLGLEGLKEAIMFTLKDKYCHHFHKPCLLCIVGVLECFPMSSIYGLDDLYHKCLKWITKHFCQVWPTKAFATLPAELLDKCYQNHIVNLSVDNLVETVYGCGITASSLQNSRWSESIARMCRRLINAAAHFAAPRLVAVFQSITPLPSEAPLAAKQALDDCLAAAIEWAPPEEALRAYGFLSALVKEIRNQHNSKPDLISNGTGKIIGPGSNLLYTHASSWRLQCEGALVRASPRVVTTQAFKDLPSDLRKRLRELGCIKYGAHAIPLTPSSSFKDTERKSKASLSHNKNVKPSTSTNTRSNDIAQVRASFVPYSPKPVIPFGSMDTFHSSNDLRDIMRPMPATHPPKVRTTKAQEERAKFNKTKNTKSQDCLNTKATVVRVLSFENTKPRYLEPKPKRTVVNKHLPKIESSSESSRNSSPVQLRNLKSSPQKGKRGERGNRGEKRERDIQTMSQDSLATSSRPRTAEPSTDSLSESQTSNKYATYTKARHAKGSIESIKTSRNDMKNFSKSNYKTKIPVYLNQVSKPKHAGETRNSRDSQKRCMLTSNIEALSKPIDRKVPGSLMMATKSSSAKIVPKVVKEPQPNKSITRSPRNTHMSRSHKQENKEPRDIPLMDRSGTFLKDEPTFGDKTTSIDIGQ